MILVTALLSFVAAEWFGGGDDEEPAEHSPQVSFLVLVPDEEPRPFGSLDEAIQHAQNGATIEIHSPEPVELPGFELEHDLEIRSAPGTRAELVFRPAPDGHDVLFSTSRHLTLEGLVIHVEPRSEHNHIAAVATHDAELRIVNCQIMNPDGPGVVAAEARRVEIEGSEIQSPRHLAVSCELTAGGHLEIHASFLVGQIPLRLSVFADDVEAHVTDTALLGRHAVAFRSDFDIDAEEPCHLRFVTESVALVSLDEPLLLFSEEMPEGDAVAEVIEWEGHGNLRQSREFDESSPMIGVEIGNPDSDEKEFDIPDWSPETPEEWRELSSVTEEESHWGDGEWAERFEEVFERLDRGEFVPRELMVRDDQRDE